MLFFRNKRRTEEAAVTYVPADRDIRLEKRARLAFFKWLFLIFFVFLGVALFFLKTPFFRIKEINISGNNLVPKDAVLALLLGHPAGIGLEASILGADHFLNWPDSLSAEELRLMPAVKNITIDKNYRDRSVSVRVEEREPYGIWCRTLSSESPESAQCWWFDDDGTIFKRAVRAEGSLISSVADYSQDDLGLGAKILPEKFLANIFSVFDTLRASGPRIREIMLEDIGLQEVAVQTYDGPKLYFSLRFPAENALAAISSLASKSGFKDLEYLDFRVENRVYYK